VENIHRQESTLRKYMISAFSAIPGVMIYGNTKFPSTGIVSINLAGCDPAVLGAHLTGHGICARSGFHCAPLAHQTLGTNRLGGTVRFSLNHLNTKSEIDTVLTYLEDFCKKL
jgi:selenocysteine lyase/cysteine desulfurase